MNKSQQSRLTKIASVLLLTLLLLPQQSASRSGSVPQQATQTHTVPAAASSLHFEPNLGQ